MFKLKQFVSKLSLAQPTHPGFACATIRGPSCSYRVPCLDKAFSLSLFLLIVLTSFVLSLAGMVGQLLRYSDNVGCLFVGGRKASVEGKYVKVDWAVLKDKLQADTRMNIDTKMLFMFDFFYLHNFCNDIMFLNRRKKTSYSGKECKLIETMPICRHLKCHL